MFMNKKVLTLCAGFLLAGFTSVNAENFEEAAKVKDGLSLVYVNNQVSDISSNFEGSYILSADAEENFAVPATEENKKDPAYLWKVEKSTNNGVLLGYKLVNNQTGKALTVTAGGTSYETFNGDPIALWFATGKGFIGKADDVTADGATTGQPNSVWRYNLQQVEDEEITDDATLNELYNSTGFNLAINGDFDDVDNIFENQRIKAIRIDGTGVVSGENRDFVFPAGTYFVTETPAGTYDGTYEYLQNCTFIVVSPSTNDINDADRRKAGEGFQLTTVSGRALQMYTGESEERMSQGEDVSVYNACFKVVRHPDGRLDLSLPVLRFNETATATSQSTKENIHLGVTKKVGYDNEYLSTSGASATYAFVFKEVASVKATALLNEKAKAVYTFQFVSEDEAVDGKYLYSNAYSYTGDASLYAKGAAFVDTDLPETQWVITNVDVEGESYNITFVNRADKSVSFIAKLYAEEGDDTYSLALVKNQQGFSVTVLSVDKEGNIIKDKETPSYPLHEAWVKLEQVTPDKYAGTWNVADGTEVTMLFARDNTPTSNKLYVSNLDEDGNATTNLVVTNNLSDALQFQLVKAKDSTIITNPCAYKEGDVVKFTSVSDTIAYYTYKLEAYYDGVSLDKFLVSSSDAYELGDNGANFIIKENVDGSFALLENTYGQPKALVVEDWNTNKEDATIKDFADGEHGIERENMTELMKANYIKTYLNLEAPEVSLDTDKSYVVMKSEVGETYLQKNDENDAIMAAVETPMTLRVFATDTKKEVPSFYIATDWNENGERMFMFNPADSVDYYVAEGEFNKKYQWDEETNKVIFKKAYLDESLANLDTLVTEIKGQKATIANKADDNKKVQGGLDKFKFQIVLADNEENLYWIRQNGEYLTNINGKLTLVGDRTNALKVEIADTDAPTANESINAAEAVQVVATNGAVIVKGAEGKNVVVSTILGKVVANEVLNSDNETIAAPAGIVVVSVDGESFKVAVK